MADDDLVLDDDQPILEKLGLDLTVSQWIKLIVRLLFCTFGVVGLKIYEVINIEQLRTEQNQLQSDLDEFNKQKDQIKKDSKAYDSIAGQSNQLHATVSIIQTIANKRELAIKGLDQIQHAVPKQLWLNKINYSHKKFLIEGMAASNKDIQVFVKQLESTHLFKKVHLTESRESSQSVASGVHKKVFNLESILN